MTTSRMILLAFLILAVALLICYARARIVLALAGLSVVALASWRGDQLFDSPMAEINHVQERMTKTEDRHRLYGYVISRIRERPLIGWGNVDAHEGGDLGFVNTMSYHNSYLKVMARGGLFQFLAFLFLIYPRGLFKHFRSPYVWILFYSLSGALVQTLLDHPHYIMVYSAMIHHRHVLVGKPKHDSGKTQNRKPGPQRPLRRRSTQLLRHG